MNVTLQSELLSRLNVSVILEWTLPPESALYSYNISVVPQASQLNFYGSTRAQLTLSYNTLYNVSVVARHLCGNASVATSIQLYYGK